MYLAQERRVIFRSMSAFPDRNAVALLVIDVQVNVVKEAFDRAAVIAHINSLVDAARKKHFPVIWVQHSDEGMQIDSAGWQLAPELHPADDEVIIFKKYRSSFEETDLEQALEKLGVGHLVITGAESNNCVRFTSHAALDRGYDITLVSDAHTTSDYTWTYGSVSAEEVIKEQNGSFAFYDLPGRSANVKSTAEILAMAESY
jgi:nicotinamidase-related amidase